MTDLVFPLTERELQTLDLIWSGKTTAQISILLKIAVRTVEAHRYSIQRKLGARGNIAMLKAAIAHGLIKVSA